MPMKVFDPNKMKNSGSWIISNYEYRIGILIFKIGHLKSVLILKTVYAVIFLMPRNGFEHKSMSTDTVRITKLNLEDRISN